MRKSIIDSGPIHAPSIARMFASFAKKKTTDIADRRTISRKRPTTCGARLCATSNARTITSGRTKKFQGLRGAELRGGN